MKYFILLNSSAYLNYHYFFQQFFIDSNVFSSNLLCRFLLFITIHEPTRTSTSSDIPSSSSQQPLQRRKRKEWTEYDKYVKAQRTMQSIQNIFDVNLNVFV